MATRKIKSEGSKRKAAKPIIFKAMLTAQQVERGEKRAEDWGVTRRLAYYMLSKNSDELTRAFAKSPKVAHQALDFYENIQAYLNWRKGETELLEAAQARILSVMEEVQKQVAQPASVVAP